MGLRFGQGLNFRSRLYTHFSAYMILCLPSLVEKREREALVEALVGTRRDGEHPRHPFVFRTASVAPPPPCDQALTGDIPECIRESVEAVAKVAG